MAMQSELLSYSPVIYTKAKAYAMAEKYLNRFIKKNGSVVCRELLGYDLSKPEEKAVILEDARLFKRESDFLSVKKRLS